MNVALKAGGNFVVYTGRAQASLIALDSIAPYLAKAVWYWNNHIGDYEIVQTPGFPVWDRTDMVPYGCYWIEVTQDCTWTYGPEETAPTSVYLWADRYNIVPYLGPEQPVEAGFASIIDFLSNWYYSDKEIWRQPSLMVPNGVYAVFVTQNCVWEFELVVPVVAGTISRKELEYDEVWGAIPVLDIPQGERGLVHIWGRNDTDKTQRMGISWIVTDPDGIIVQEYDTWEAWPYTGPGSEHGFLASRFNLDKAGAYILNVGLFMNPEAPEMVDSYDGFLCTVAAVVPEPAFAGFGITEYTER